LISRDYFYFFEGRNIHEEIGVAQEGLHNIKVKKAKGAVERLIYVRLMIG